MTKLRKKNINHILKTLEKAFDESNTLKQWEEESYNIYVSMCSFDYEIFLKLKKYVGV